MSKPHFFQRFSASLNCYHHASLAFLGEASRTNHYYGATNPVLRLKRTGTGIVFYPLDGRPRAFFRAEARHNRAGHQILIPRTQSSNRPVARRRCLTSPRLLLIKHQHRFDLNGTLVKARYIPAGLGSAQETQRCVQQVGLSLPTPGQ